MAFFKSKQEKEIIEKMEREDQMTELAESLAEMSAKRQDYAKIAAEAEIAGDTASYDLAVNALLELNDWISSLNQQKINFDIISLSDSIAIIMAKTMNIIDKMANKKSKMPNIKKIQKTQLKMNKYMREITISQKAMAGTMKRTNPANKPHTQEQLESVRPLIDAERAKLMPTLKSSGVVSNDVVDLTEEIAKEKNRIV